MCIYLCLNRWNIIACVHKGRSKQQTKYGHVLVIFLLSLQRAGLNFPPTLWYPDCQEKCIYICEIFLFRLKDC